MIDHAVRGSRQDNLDIYNTDDLDTFAALLHYVEAMFARYDANYDGVINRVEADEAFKVFINKLSSVSGFTKQYSNKVLFHYLLYYGEAPNAESLIDKAKYAVWFMQEPFVEITTDKNKNSSDFNSVIFNVRF